MSNLEVSERKWHHTLFRPLLNLIGLLNGYGSCHVCGDSWWWKKTMDHTIWYTKNTGAAHICAECWKNASDEQIIDATIKLDEERKQYSSWTSEKAASLMEATKRDLSKREKSRARLNS